MGALDCYRCSRIQKSPLFNHRERKREAELELRMNFSHRTVLVSVLIFVGIIYTSKLICINDLYFQKRPAAIYSKRDIFHKAIKMQKKNHTSVGKRRGKRKRFKNLRYHGYLD